MTDFDFERKKNINNNNKRVILSELEQPRFFRLKSNRTAFNNTMIIKIMKNK